MVWDNDEKKKCLNKKLVVSVNTQYQSKNIRYISVLRVIAILSVLAIHVVRTPSTGTPWDMSQFEFQLSAIVAAVFNAFAVPVFIMISGALFLNPDKEITLKKLITKYSCRIFLVILTIGSLFALMEIVFNNRSFAPIDVLQAIRNALVGKTWSHFWYLYLIIALYLVTPVFRAFVEKTSNNELIGVLIIMYVFSIALPLLCSIVNIPQGFHIPFANFCFYYLAGYAIHSDRLKINNNLCIALIVLSVAYIVGMSFLKDNIMFCNFEINNVSYIGIMSIAVFALTKNCVSGDTRKVELFLANMSFGVYIFHALFLNFIYKFLKITPEHYSFYILWPCIFIITAIGSVVLTYIWKKIPYLNRLL